MNCYIAEFFWRCILRKQVQKVLAVILAFMSAAILLAEATLLPNLDLSLFSLLINTVGQQEVLVQVCYSLMFLEFSYSVDMLRLGVWANVLSVRYLEHFLGFISDSDICLSFRG